MNVNIHEPEENGMTCDYSSSRTLIYKTPSCTNSSSVSTLRGANCGQPEATFISVCGRWNEELFGSGRNVWLMWLSWPSRSARVHKTGMYIIENPYFPPAHHIAYSEATPMRIGIQLLSNLHNCTDWNISQLGLGGSRSDAHAEHVITLSTINQLCLQN